MIGERNNVVDQAVAWHLRQREMTGDDWVHFIGWIEADPAHAAAFDRIVIEDRLLSDQVALRPAQAPGVPANDDTRQPRTRRGWLWAVGGVAVAAGAVALLMPLALPGAADPYTVATRPGERQNIALADGTRIEVSGGTRLALDRRNPRVATLETGEATFHVRHDETDPFTLRSGGLTVRDLGTVFNVTRDGPRLDVEVAEGSVLFQPGREALTLRPGSALSAHQDAGTVDLSEVAIDTVGGWRNGQLTFAGEPLSYVAASIRRLYGIDLVVDPGLSARPFTGMVRLSGVAERDMPHLAALVGARWRQDGERWILSPMGPEQP